MPTYQVQQDSEDGETVLITLVDHTVGVSAATAVAFGQALIAAGTKALAAEGKRNRAELAQALARVSR